MSDLRSLYYKALVDPFPQSVDDLAKRYRSLKSAILYDSEERENTYNILFNYTDIKTLLQVLKAERNQHISALDEIFYKLTRGIELLKRPFPPEEYEPKTAVMAAYMEDVYKYEKQKTVVTRPSSNPYMVLSSKSSRRIKYPELNFHSLRSHYWKAYCVDLIKLAFSEGDVRLYVLIFLAILFFDLVYFSSNKTISENAFALIFNIHLFSVVAIVVTIFEVLAPRIVILQADINEYLQIDAKKKEYEREFAVFEIKRAENGARLKRQMLEEQTKPPTEKEAAGIDL